MRTPPSDATLFEQLQQRSGWTKQNTLAAPDTSIGPNPPQDCFLITAPPGDPTGMFLGIIGQAGKYCDWLTALSLGWIPNSGNAQLQLTVNFDPRFFTAGQAAEFDFINRRGGYNALFGFQILPNGQMQISNPAGGWQAASQGPKLTPGVHSFVFDYTWNDTTHAFTFLNVNIDGVDYAPPAAENPQTESNPKWTDGFTVQIQQDTTASGGAYWEVVDNVNLYVW